MKRIGLASVGMPSRPRTKVWSEEEEEVVVVSLLLSPPSPSFFFSSLSSSFFFFPPKEKNTGLVSLLLRLVARSVQLSSSFGVGRSTGSAAPTPLVRVRGRATTFAVSGAENRRSRE